ncbi:hypothetical protein YA0002_06830 [Pseudomonas cichorii]|uniref:hypothetical protein n=1 Tax=Pseudomonas cichorii TaxID=36746 RepID=UPI0018E5B8B5|nr:hypothetical protein [Pseudomonas cichorii]MBI6852475.1 hypothetical protein [Pseudomonas cichorii]
MSLSTDTQTTAVMGDSRETLLKWLQENPKTLGWDAIVVYNRGRANALLLQQYIRKLTAENYMTPIDGEITGEEGSKLHFFGIQLGLPRLSFENADIENSKARVTQPVTSGLAILNSEPTGGFKGIHSIMRPNGAAGPTLWMDVALQEAPGDVTEAGVVQIDLSKMTHFDTDLFSDPVSIINAQEFFLKRFQENPELQVYKLGSLSQSADSTLTPEKFIIRTQPAPGAKNRAAPNYGDGAVVLMVRVKGGTDGGAPTKDSDFRYLIPNDENGTKYSSALLLSNKKLFSTLLRAHLRTVLPGLAIVPKIPVDSGGNPGHMYLECEYGSIGKSDYKYVNHGYYSNFIVTATAHYLGTSVVGAKFSAQHNSICFTWLHGESVVMVHYHNTRADLEDSHDDDPVTFNFRVIVDSTPHVNPENGTIEFEQDTFNTGQIEITVPSAHYVQNHPLYEANLRQVFQDTFFHFIKKITVPDIDTFLLRNLLFPDSNAMVLTDAYVPGDLAVFGNVDPSLTSFVIEPENAILNPAATKAFKTVPEANVTWSVKGLPGDDQAVGTIDSQGVYKAPTQTELKGRDAQQVIITAAGTTARGIAATSSTLVSIVGQTISLNPIFLVAGPAKKYGFTAGAIDERPLNWAMKDPGQGGKVEPATGKKIDYTAPPATGTGMFTLEVLQVTDNQGNMGKAHILVINSVLGGQVEADMTQAANGKSKLRFMKQYSSGPVEVPSHLLTWTLLAGPGSVDATGLYTEPQEQLPGFCIITCAFPHKPEFEGAPIPIDYGYITLPLPLSLYPNIGRAYR